MNCAFNDLEDIISKDINDKSYVPHNQLYTDRLYNV